MQDMLMSLMMVSSLCIGTYSSLPSALDKIETADNLYARATDIPRNVQWVKPILVAEVSFSEWTRDGRIRHPSFQGLRAQASLVKNRFIRAPRSLPWSAQARPALRTNIRTVKAEWHVLRNPRAGNFRQISRIK